MTKEKNNRQIGIRVSENTWRELTELADQKKISVTEYGRRAIQKQMDIDRKLSGENRVREEDIAILIETAVDERLNNDTIKAKEIQIQLLSEQLKSKDEQIKLLREMLQLYKSQGNYELYLLIVLLNQK